MHECPSNHLSLINVPLDLLLVFLQTLTSLMVVLVMTELLVVEVLQVVLEVPLVVMVVLRVQPLVECLVVL